MRFMVMFLTLLLVMSVFTFGDGTNSSVQKAQELISSKRFMTESGLQELKSISSYLDEKTKLDLYYANRKIPALGFLSFAVLSLGNWLVGDKEGGVTSLLVGGIGLSIYIGGFIYSAYSLASSIDGVAKTGKISMGYYIGLIIAHVGLGMSIGGYFYSAFHAYSYGNKYNETLKEGLTLNLEYNYFLNNMMNFVTENRSLFNRKEEIVNFDLVAIRF